MRVLTWFIVREVIKGSSLAILLLLTLFNLFSFSDELKDLGRGHYDLKHILMYLALTSPRVFFELIPYAALLGSLFVVGAMANNREIVAMRAAGYSIAWIIRSIMLAGLILVAVSVAVGELVAPDSERYAQVMKSTALNDGVVLRSKYGMWLREGNRFINVRHLKDDGSLADMRIFEIDDARRLTQVTQAGFAKPLGKQNWQLQDVQQSNVTAQRITANNLAEQNWHSSIDADLLKVAVVNSDDLSLLDLYQYIDFLKHNNQKAQRYELAFWSRMVTPLVTFVMLMVSLPFVLSIGRGSSSGARILIGTIIGVVFNIADRIIGNMGLVYDINPVLIALLPSTVVFLIALFAVSRVG